MRKLLLIALLSCGCVTIEVDAAASKSGKKPKAHKMKTHHVSKKSPIAHTSKRMHSSKKVK